MAIPTRQLNPAALSCPRTRASMSAEGMNFDEVDGTLEGLYPDEIQVTVECMDPRSRRG
jgi:hypothetical protein